MELDLVNRKKKQYKTVAQNNNNKDKSDEDVQKES